MKKDLYSHLKKLPHFDTSIAFFSAHKQKVPKEWGTDQHSHTAFEILLILDGAQETMLNQKKYLLQKNDILLIAPGVLHTNRCFSLEGMSYFTAHFDIDDPSLRYLMIKNGRLIYPDLSEENQILRVILDEWILFYDKPAPYTLFDRLSILEILTRLLTAFVKILEEDMDNQCDIQSLSIARALAETIQHHFRVFSSSESHGKETLLLETIYRDAGVSMSYGLEVFKKIYHLSPKKYLDHLKLKEAQRLLKNPDVSIEAISERVGYANTAHFSRQFKKWTGVSPRNYRQNNF